MRILYGIQGTGNGHLSRAVELMPYLKMKAEVDVLISGLHHDLEFPFPIKYQMKGLGFFFGRNGGIDLGKTIRHFNLPVFLRDIRRVPVEDYDLVISDFEPVTSWACRMKKKFCLGLSHQSALLSPQTPLPEKKELFGHWVLRNYAPCTRYISFHFQEYDEQIFTPVIRREIRELSTVNNGHYTVYLPSFHHDELALRLNRIKGVNWEVFSKYAVSPMIKDQVRIFPVQADTFIHSMRTSEGILCGAGFETPAEALYLGKKLIVVPMKGQFEQQCNAFALSRMGIPVLSDLGEKNLQWLDRWLKDGKSALQVEYPDNAQDVVDLILHHFTPFGD